MLFFLSHMINGCNLWSLTPNNKKISRIERLQKKCVRIMTFAPFNSHTNPIFQELELLIVQDVIKIHQMKLVFDFHRRSLPDDLMNLFKLTTDVQATNLVLSSTKNNSLLHSSFQKNDTRKEIDKLSVYKSLEYLFP